MTSTDDVAANLAARERGSSRRRPTRGAALVALPENFAFLRREGAPIPCAQGLDGEIVGALRALARARCACASSAARFPEAIAGRRARPQHQRADLAGGRDRGRLPQDPPLRRRSRRRSGGGVYRESARVAPGRGGRRRARRRTASIGLSVCYDLRFPELYRALAARGARFLVRAERLHAARPGKDHWEVLLRARAIENQAFVLAPAQCGRHSADAREPRALADRRSLGPRARAGRRPARASSLADCDLEEQDAHPREPARAAPPPPLKRAPAQGCPKRLRYRSRRSPGGRDVAARRGRAPARAALVIRTGDFEGTRYPLAGEETLIGRNPTTDITLLDEGISREHALILLRRGTRLVHDRGSPVDQRHQGERQARALRGARARRRDRDRPHALPLRAPALAAGGAPRSGRVSSRGGGGCADRAARERERQPRPHLRESLQPGAGVGPGERERPSVGREPEPDERPLDGAPAELEAVGAAAARRAAEIEAARAARDRPAQRLPVDQVVRAALALLAQRRGPGDASPRRRSGSPRDRRSVDPRACVHHEAQPRTEGGGRGAEEAARVHRGAEVAHVAQERLVEAAAAAPRVGPSASARPSRSALRVWLRTLAGSAFHCASSLACEREHEVDAAERAWGRPGGERLELAQLEPLARRSRAPARARRRAARPPRRARRPARRRCPGRAARPARAARSRSRKRTSGRTPREAAAGVARRQVLRREAVGLAQHAVPRRGVAESGSRRRLDERVPFGPGVRDAFDVHGNDYIGGGFHGL